MQKVIRKPIQLNPSPELREKIEQMAREENRFMGPMVTEIVRRFFAQMENAAGRIKTHVEK
jgi:hypothetical protein